MSIAFLTLAILVAYLKFPCPQIHTFPLLSNATDLFPPAATFTMFSNFSPFASNTSTGT